jgi:hypothetical protein
MSGVRSRIQDRLVDDMVSAYADWREASRLVHSAYRSWSIGPTVSAGDAFRRYTAALDSEEIAADVYSDLVRRVGRVVTIDHGDPWPAWPAPSS